LLLGASEIDGYDIACLPGHPGPAVSSLQEAYCRVAGSGSFEAEEGDMIGTWPCDILERKFQTVDEMILTRMSDWYESMGLDFDDIR